MLFTVITPELKCTFVLKTWNVCDITSEVREIHRLLVSFIYLLLPIKSFFSNLLFSLKTLKLQIFFILNNSLLTQMIPRFLT